jgi:hypothetical protein
MGEKKSCRPQKKGGRIFWKLESANAFALAMAIS